MSSNARRHLVLAAMLGVAIAAPRLAAQTPERIDVRYGRAPSNDGTMSPGEWDDAGRLSLEVEPGWTVDVRYKHDEANLFFAFVGLRRGARERYPELMLDMAGDRSAAWDADDHWFHASYRDCDATGRANLWDCAATRPGWRANNFPLTAAGTVETRISYARLDLAPGRERTVGIALDVTDTRERWSFWPRSARLDSPATWAVASSSDRWGAPPRAARPLAGRIDTLRIASALTPDTMDVAVYLPPGYDSRRRYPVIYAVGRQVYVDHPHVAAPLVLDSAMAAGLPPAVVVALPFGGAADAHHPDTPAGRAWQRSVVEEVVPEVERRYAVGHSRAERLLLGFSSGANVVVDLAVDYPGHFARVAAQSPGWMDWSSERRAIGRVFLEEAVADIRAASGDSLPAFWFVWGDGDMEWETRARENGEIVLRALRERGARVERADPVAGEHGLHLVTRSLRPALRFLLETERR